MKSKNLDNLKAIQDMLMAMSVEVHNANTRMSKSELALMFKKADSIRGMAKYIVASQNAINQHLWLSNDCDDKQ